MKLYIFLVHILTLADIQRGCALLSVEYLPQYKDTKLYNIPVCDTKDNPHKNN